MVKHKIMEMCKVYPDKQPFKKKQKKRPQCLECKKQPTFNFEGESKIGRAHV